MSCSDPTFDERLGRTRDNTVRHLLNARSDTGFWNGHLSSSPLATAVSIVALHIADAQRFESPIRIGLSWLAAHQNPDGGWGDTDNRDPSNLSTTLLALAALYAIDRDGRYAAANSKARVWLKSKLHCTHESDLAEAVITHTAMTARFAVPILTHCTLAGLFKDTAEPWQFVKPLPFELARLPRALYRVLNLTVVSYALPALIAVGQAKFHFDPPNNPIVRAIRRAACGPTLELLRALQPINGGFLEAPPLTAFVTMSLASLGQTSHPVAQKGLAFLTAAMRPDGSWPIDTNLSTWLSTHAIKSLNKDNLSADERHGLTQALVKQQHKAIHPFTGAAPGGWGWSDLPGAVPDADDTAGALVALHRLGLCCDNVRQAALAGLRWLLDLQNSDGGIPTFCRGWGKLEFDRSCADITAHAIEAFVLWRDQVPAALRARIDSATVRALRWLYAHQRNDGAWLPLWFGNPTTAEQTNPVYGTARVLSALAQMDRTRYPILEAMLPREAMFLSGAQQTDGGWGSIEETGLAVAALSRAAEHRCDAHRSIRSGVDYLIETTNQGTAFSPAPIGLYFAKLWYTEDLYPVLFALDGLQTAQTLCSYSGPYER
jgi:squalene-hopene/tetraprenyl-beta-curcumene cyclase